MEAVKKTVSSLQLVSFCLDKEIYAVDVMKVCGVERIMEITALPGMPVFIDGVINLRNTIIPIIDLRKRFSLPPQEHGKDTRIILIELDEKMVIGVIVDSVQEVFQIDPNMIGKVPRVGGRKLDARFIKGVVQKSDKLIIIMDIEKLFSEDETKDMLDMR